MDPALLDVSPTLCRRDGNDIYLFGQFETCSDVLDDECTQDPNAGLVIFKSSDGGAWQQLAQPANIIQAEFDGVTVWDNTLGRVGCRGRRQRHDHGLDEHRWSGWTPSTGIGGLDPVDSMAAAGPGLVAFGAKFDDTIEDTQLVAASSTDGLHYSTASAPAVTGAQVVSITPGPGGMAGVGYADSDTSPSVAMALFSPDGTNWSQVNSSDRFVRERPA